MAKKYGKQTMRFDSRYPGSYLSGHRYYRLVWHTTEGTGLPAYSKGAVAPHFTVNVKTGEVHQHFAIDRPARALEHRAGKIDTNNMWAVQVEIIAFSDKAMAKKYDGLHVGDFTDKHYAVLAKLARFIESQTNIQASHPVKTKPYPASYGDGNGCRISDKAWRTFNGHCEHQNVPHNNHGDAGSLDLARIMPAKKPLPVPVPKGDDVLILIREKGQTHVYASNLVNRRHLRGHEAAVDTAAVMRAAGVPTAVLDVEAGTLDHYGVLVGPDWNE